MKVAVEGCCHGELDAIYSAIADLENKNQYKIDLLLICGDFQAIRNHRDLQCMAVPDKYKHLQHFYKYYTGEKTAPILTIVIGGNHEASNYMWELFYGGWLAPNIYFLGHAGSVLVNRIRISGASGIFKGYNFTKGYFERQPYNKDDLRSIYHLRESNIRKLSLLPTPKIFLSHDWPLDIDKHGDTRALVRQKPYFRDEIDRNAFGAPPLMGLLRNLQPEWWFSAHMHVRFEATVLHPPLPESISGPSQVQAVQPVEKIANPDEIVIGDDELDEPASAAQSNAEPESVPEAGPSSRIAINPDEIMLDDEEFDVAPPPPPPAPAPVPSASSPITRFVALDKCLPKRKFLEIVDVDTPTLSSLSSSQSSSQSPSISYDPYWLAITRAFHTWLSLDRWQKPFPDEATARDMVRAEFEWVKKNLLNIDASAGDASAPGIDAVTSTSGALTITDVQQFVLTAPGPGTEGKDKLKQPQAYSNPQTEAFCRWLQIYNCINPGASSS